MRLIEGWYRVSSLFRRRRPERDLEDYVGVPFVRERDAVGAMAAVLLHRFAASLLYGVGPVQASVGLAVSFLAPVALAACLVPAIRTTRVDPLKALRHE
jgi:hypothetical protein